MSSGCKDLNPFVFTLVVEAVDDFLFVLPRCWAPDGRRSSIRLKWSCCSLHEIGITARITTSVSMSPTDVVYIPYWWMTCSAHSGKFCVTLSRECQPKWAVRTTFINFIIFWGNRKFIKIQSLSKTRACSTGQSIFIIIYRNPRVAARGNVTGGGGGEENGGGVGDLGRRLAEGMILIRY